MLKLHFTDREARQFETYFGEPLSDYWDKLSGFDVVMFDERLIRPPGGTSTAQACAALGESKGFAGENVVAFIHRLIGR